MTKQEPTQEDASDQTKIITFADLNLRTELLTAITKLGYTVPTPIQYEVITKFATGNHIVWQSQTGTWKTAAFAIPLVNSINAKLRKPQALILAPTRELATQTEEEFFKLSHGSLGIKTATLTWWRNMSRQMEKIQQWAQLIIWTPGRIIDFIKRRMIDLSQVQYLVLDEADRMLDMGFVEDVDFIISQIDNLKQLMSFSATITKELNDILNKYIWSDYDFIKINTEAMVAKIEHAFIHMERMNKLDVLDKYLTDHKDQNIVIFTQTKIAVDDVVRNIESFWFEAAGLHWDIRQYERNQIIRAYKNNELKILVATDVASRWLNLNDVNLVINFDVPQDPESYIHRVGRTGRAGKEGKAITFAHSSEMKYIDSIERRNKITIKQIDIEWNEIVRAPKRSAGSRSAPGRWSFSRNSWGRSSFGGQSRWGFVKSTGPSKWWYTNTSRGDKSEKKSYSSDSTTKRTGVASSWSDKRPSFDKKASVASSWSDKRPPREGYAGKKTYWWGDRSVDNWPKTFPKRRFD